MHHKTFVDCATGVVYSVPLSCGHSYVGQRGRCLNIRLQKHCQKVKNVDRDGSLASHCSESSCQSLFEKTQALAAHLDDGIRIIIEVVRIAKGSCVSKPSIFLSDKELAYLDSSSCGEYLCCFFIVSLHYHPSLLVICF